MLDAQTLHQRLSADGAAAVHVVDAYSEDSSSDMSTWQSTSTGSSIGSSMLDESDTHDVLVYRYRSGAPRLEIQSQQSLSKVLKSDPRFRISKKRIPRGNSRVDVRMEDLFTDGERPAYQNKPNYRSSVACVGLPSNVYWRHLLFNSFPELYIVSPVSSPENTPESSQHVSPSNTFPHAAAAAGAPGGGASQETSQESGKSSAPDGVGGSE